MRWQQKLNKRELRHLRETCAGKPTLEQFKANRRVQNSGELGMRCPECRHIALKLGLEKS